ncbi:class I SAM-dependent methyltransferase [Geothermobacter hydrogeniphilus]|uniref:Methyltransferase type 11 n=1 Tax=Geothermobacter hydrogeniphilus TaxID=1969733 RepID=A0A1X0Y5X5_9BACT|nr:class I SAM-dependent methyltransferase [Geothermobacter hydrogeniphilus]ORJ60600.1 methyltransferase type 11 [Geothermobacter hydrogeniphilus]
MKTRESGMPDEEIWTGFFNPEKILEKLGLSSTAGSVVEFGCGYGTFSIPAAQMISGRVYAIDIDAEMVTVTAQKAQQTNLDNLQTLLRDFIKEGTGLADSSIDYVMLFNILHAEQPELLLNEALRILAPHGRLAIIHWNYDPTTPRGPSMEIRPRPEQCQVWAEAAGFQLLPPGLVDLPPYHYGLLFERVPEKERQ